MSLFKQNSIICAVRSETDLEAALNSASKYVFLLKADINTAKEVVGRCRAAGKTCFIHLDLAEGISKDDAGIKYVAEQIRPDGVLSTRLSVVRTAGELGLKTIYRVFMVDRQALDSAMANVAKFAADAVEVMPGIAYEAVAAMKTCSADVIAGGLIRSRANVDSAFRAGAVACSTSNKALWNG